MIAKDAMPSVKVDGIVSRHSKSGAENIVDLGMEQFHHAKMRVEKDDL